MEIDKVRELVKLVEESGIEELEVSHGEITVRIQKSAACRDGGGAAALAGQPVPLGAFAGTAPAPSPATAPSATPETPPPAQEEERAKWMEIRSPIVGTFYRAPAPNAEPFVSVGDRISRGQTLCIIEAMKVMNEIEAEFGGVVKEILVENGQPVEAEGILFLIDPS